MFDQDLIRFVATGDSITEGLGDLYNNAPDGQWRGWADRLALHLAEHHATHTGAVVQYANLAVRSRRIEHVVDEQIPQALALEATIVSVMVGANDLGRPAADPDALASRLETSIVALRKVGCTVLLATSFDPNFMPILRPFRGRAAIFTANLWSIAQTHGVHIIDLWGTPDLQLPEMRSEDRVHLSPAGHRLVAHIAATSLGIHADDGPAEQASIVRGRSSLGGWAVNHALPWAIRRLRGRTAGDGLYAKRPALTRFEAPTSDKTTEHVGTNIVG